MIEGTAIDDLLRSLDADEEAFAILQELYDAKKKFPWWPRDPVHAAAIVAEEAGELVQAALQATYEDGDMTAVSKEAVQVGAMAIRFLQNLYRYVGRKSEQMSD